MYYLINRIYIAVNENLRILHETCSRSGKPATLPDSRIRCQTFYINCDCDIYGITTSMTSWSSRTRTRTPQPIQSTVRTSDRLLGNAFRSIRVRKQFYETSRNEQPQRRQDCGGWRDGFVEADQSRRNQQQQQGMNKCFSLCFWNKVKYTSSVMVNGYINIIHCIPVGVHRIVVYMIVCWCTS